MSNDATDSADGYDVIGDVHGHVEQLEALLANPDSAPNVVAADTISSVASP